MVDPSNDNREDFVINEDYPQEEVEDLHREEYYGNSANVFRKKSNLPFIIGGVALIVLVVIFVIILSGGDDVVDRDYIQSLEKRIEHLENKLATIGAMDQTMEQLDRQARELNALAERLKGFESTVTTQIDQIIKELGTLYQRTAREPVSNAPTGPPAGNKSPAVTQKRPTAPEFHLVQAGDTLYRIGRRYGLTVEQLRSYNNLAPDAAIYPGQKLKLRPNGKP
jgi:LysM repeat protein